MVEGAGMNIGRCPAASWAKALPEMVTRPVNTNTLNRNVRSIDLSPYQRISGRLSAEVSKHFSFLVTIATLRRASTVLAAASPLAHQPARQNLQINSIFNHMLLTNSPIER